MKRTLALLIISTAAFGAAATGPVDARKLRDIGGAIVYPGRKAIKNAGHNAKHIAGDPNRRRLKKARHSQHGRKHARPRRHGPH